MKKIFFLMMLLGLAGCGENNDSMSPSTQNVSVQKTALTRSANLNNTNQVCSYNFDATQEDFDQFYDKYPMLLKDRMFPTVNGQNFEFVINQALANKELSQYIGASKGYFKMAQGMADNNKDYIKGDASVPLTGIISFEAKVKVNLKKVSDILLGAGFEIYGHTIKNEKLAMAISYANSQLLSENISGPRGIVFSYVYMEMDKTDENNIIYDLLDLNDTSAEYQHVGFYINQDSKKIGVIINGRDKGYLAKIPSEIDKLLFIAKGFSQVTADFLGDTQSVELITDRNALEFKYPEGTTDICGNLI
ncbi:DUF4882 family protein [Acinetobacter stercoris]|uniref:DUF4882 domain-containing protein n=1 Tax=Acinetobacter stercoris TaxID=2126983 RepID=A0A2U3N276_9GAMM|nr:DUF4882 family protein [Acinetobacter stercoris]SPL71715.1 hypothetical protein KPC_2893 [Acinetobacter stercoris]